MITIIFAVLLLLISGCSFWLGSLYTIWKMHVAGVISFEELEERVKAAKERRR